MCDVQTTELHKISMVAKLYYITASNLDTEATEEYDLVDLFLNPAKYMTEECYPSDSVSNVGGNVLTSWGTGMQGGLKICY